MAKLTVILSMRGLMMPKADFSIHVVKCRRAPCRMFIDLIRMFLTKRNNPNIVFPSELSFLSAIRTKSAIIRLRNQ